jgi:hypothetical protein
VRTAANVRRSHIDNVANDINNRVQHRLKVRRRRVSTQKHIERRAQQPDTQASAQRHAESTAQHNEQGALSQQRVCSRQMSTLASSCKVS